MANYTVSDDIDDFMKSSDDAAARTELGLGSAATSNTGDLATSVQGGKADSALQASDIGATVQAQDSILDNTTASFTTAQENKLTAITGTNTGDQDLSGLQTILTEGAFVDGDKSKLDGVTGTNTGDQDLSGLQVKPSEGAFIDGDKTKLDNITGSNTGDESAAQLNIVGTVQIASITQIDNGLAADATKAVSPFYLENSKYNSDRVANNAKLTADETNVVAALDGATIPLATVASADKVLIQDGSDLNNLKYVTAQSIGELGGGGGAVDSVNTQVGVVVLDADDISDATTTNKFATQAELDKANSAIQNGDNVSTLTNDAGYLTTAPAAPVDSVNTQTGAVVLDADDISDATTTNKFTTQAEADKLAAITGTNTGDQDLSGLQTILAEGAFVDGDKTALDNLTTPTLDSVTTNGATTTNSLTVGNKFATGNNSATGGNAIALGGTNNFAIGAGSEVLGGDASTASGIGSTVIGGSGFTVSGNWSISLGGLSGSVTNSRSALLGGYNNTLTHSDSAMIVTNNVSSVANNTVHVPNLHVFNGFTLPTGATDTYVLTSDANGVGTWQAAGGGGGGSSVVASYTDKNVTINKPTSASVIVSVTGMSYQMQSGVTYYVKMFVMQKDAVGFGNDELMFLSHTPWATTAGIETGFIGKNWNDAGMSLSTINSGQTQFSGSWHEASASRMNTTSFGTAYSGFVSIEGFITAPSTATFTPQISYVSTTTGSSTCEFQGMIMEMP